MDVLLRTEGLRTYFDTYEGQVQALRGVDLDIYRGETTGLVGETGSGKSVTALSIMRLIRKPGRIAGGTIEFEGTDLLQLSEREMQALRGSKMSMIFQDARASLNPLYTVGKQIAHVYRAHTSFSDSQAMEKAYEMLESVGLADPMRVAKLFPHELSSGMCQRVMISMGLVSSPRLLIADEPTSGLDVTVQAQILDLIREVVQGDQRSCLFITHDLGVVAELCDRVAVIYAGQVVEYGDRDSIFLEPQHPYTEGLMRCSLRVDGEGTIDVIPGLVPDLIEPIDGCAYSPRCGRRTPECSEYELRVLEVAPGHFVRCRSCS